MKKQIQYLSVFFLILTLFTSCDIVEGIFKAGMGFGIFIVVAIIVLIIYIFSKLTGKK